MLRAVNESSGDRVIIKLIDRAASLIAVNNLRNEYTLLQRVRSAHVVMPVAFTTTRLGHAMVLQDIDGRPLQDAIGKQGMPLDTFLAYAEQLATGLADLHRIGIIHRDIKPDNILTDAQTGRLWIIDLGLATEITRRDAMLTATDKMLGTLQYMSPEQTGRVNHVVDLRTDLYSLGLVLYEMLVGTPPFNADDSLALMHAQLTKKPERISSLRPEVPESLGAIIAKLLEKKPEDRYASAHGVRFDLSQAARAIAIGDSSPLRLGERDFPTVFTVPAHLYGREVEIRQLKDGLDKAESQSNLVLISGYSGMGKSSLTSELYAPTLARGGYFIAGKVDQYRRDIPLDSMCQALRDLVRQILTEPAQQIDLWAKELKDSMGSNLGVIIDLVPDLVYLVGQQPRAPQLVGGDSQRRLIASMVRFVATFARAKHPLVVFFDDLQWSDRDTLILIEQLLARGGANGLLVIAAYRDNELTPHHPLAAMVNALSQRGAAVCTVALQPLSTADISQLLADACRCSHEEAAFIASVVVGKTDGNPFFVRQFLSELYEQQVLTLDEERGRWVWDEGRLLQVEATSNLIDLMTHRLQILPSQSRYVLSVAACIGGQFELAELLPICDFNATEIENALGASVQAGLLALDMIAVPKAHGDVDEPSTGSVTQTYRFSHDRVQQAAYDLVDGDLRPKIHLAIARSLQGRPGDSNIFAIANHFNNALVLLSAQDLHDLLQINLEAGRRARKSTAFDVALRYYQICSETIARIGPHVSIDVTFDCFHEKGEVEYLNGHWDEALKDMRYCLAQSPPTATRLQIVMQMCRVYRMRNELELGLRTAIDALATVGYSLTDYPDRQTLLQEHQRTVSAIQRVGMDRLPMLPLMNDPVQLAISHLLRELGSPAYLLGSDLSPLTAMLIIQIACEGGNSEASVEGLMFYAFFVASLFDEIDFAYAVGQAGMRLHERLGFGHLDAQVYDVWGGDVLHYVEPLEHCEPWLRRAITSGMESGFYVWAGYASANLMYQMFFGNRDLTTVRINVDEFIPMLKPVDPHMEKFHLMVRQALDNLTDHPERGSSLVGEWVDEAQVLTYAVATRDVFTQFTLYGIKTALALWSGDYATALQLADKAMQCLSAAVFLDPVSHYMHALAITCCWETFTDSERVVRKQRLESHMRRLHLWSERNPATYLHMYQIVCARAACNDADEEKAQRLFELGTAAALENGFLHDAALSARLVGEWVLSRGRERLARSWLADAVRYFQAWGASGTARLLSTAHEALLEGIQVHRGGSASAMQRMGSAAQSATTRSANLSDSYDLESITRAALSIAQEQTLPGLVSRLLQVIAASAGADVVALILRRGQEFFVETWHGLSEPPQPQLLESCNRLALGPVRLALRSHEPVVVTPAGRGSRFKEDTYLQKNPAIAAMCSPIIHHSEVLGALYLESSSGNAFTTGRVRILNILAAQAAVSITQARTHDALEEMVEARTSELQAAQMRLVELEKRSTENRMGGGFAHEVRNALTGAQMLLDYARGIGTERPGATTEIERSIQAALDFSKAIPDADRAAIQLCLESTVAAREVLDETITMSSRAVTRVLNVTKQIMNYAKIGESPRESEEVDVAKVVRELAQEASLEYDQDNVSIEVAEKANVPLLIHGDKEYVYLALKNFLNNARDALVEQQIASGPRRIQISVQALQDNCIVKVTDNGVGIPAENINRVFEPFFSTKPTTGTGLGMGMAKKYIQSCRGTIDLSSEIGKGTQVTVTYPLVLGQHPTLSGS